MPSHLLPAIRRARASDARAIHEAHMRSIRELCRKDYTSAQIAAWGGRTFNEADRLRMIEQEYVWVVEQAGRIAGYGNFFPVDRSGERVAWVAALYLTPEVTGQGMGRAILAAMEAEARKLGLKRIELESTLTSLGFYKAMGFNEIGPQHEHTVNGVGIPCIPMTKQI